MGSSTPVPTRAASPEFREIFRAHADTDGTMDFARFMALALYDPAVGYYRAPRRRIGCEAGTDFFTASTSNPVFGELVCAACVTLLHGAEPAEFTFVEIGAEPEAGVLQGVAHPFAAARTVRVGEPPPLAGRCVVFSNELFDAQPFRRYGFRDGRWRELGVTLRADVLAEVELTRRPTPSLLPATAPEGYVIDAPLAAAELAGALAARPWTGLFIACDYGKTWPELACDTPAGTARAYFRHAQSNDLLARPGEQDLTCHVCWDWLVGALRQRGFAEPQVQPQEAFFVRHAGRFLASTTAAEAGRFSHRKQSLLQLLHPSHLGQKFQVLHAWRE
ncbi:MAG: SAM-dependent methyltransferase [Verrucomicrobia bacterium]|nr:SAM-dependent methyltransferase [Verrucomicrobiota bacterium]